MAQPTSLFPLILQPPILPAEPDVTAPCPECFTNNLPLEKYLKHAQEMKIIDEKGQLLVSGPPLIFETTDQAELLNFWKKTQTFEKNGVVFSWNFYQFLIPFVPYFTKTFKGTTVTLTQGTYHVVGKSFWRKNLQQIATPSVIEAEELWSFCEAAPRIYQFEIHFPSEFSELNTQTTLEKFHQLSLYLLVVQKLPNPPASLLDALREFDTLLKSPEENESLRLQELRDLMKNLQKTTQACSIEIPFASDASLKVIFSFQSTFDPLSDHIRLNMGSDEPFSYELVSSSPKLFQALHDQFIHRMFYSASSLQHMLGKYWADITSTGSLFNDHEIESQLMKTATYTEEKFSTFFLKAFKQGKRYLPRGNEALIAYRSNALYFLSRHQVSLETLETVEEPQTPLGNFLVSHQPIAILQIVGILQAGLDTPPVGAPQARISLKKSQLEIYWKAPAPLYLVLSYNLEQALNQTNHWLKQQRQECLKGFAQALEVFFPSLPAISKTKVNHQLDEIYKALQSQEQFSEAALRLFLLLQGERAIEETDVLALPSWLSLSNPLTINALSIAFQGTSFFLVYSKIKESIAALDNPKPEACRLAAWHTLLICPEPKLLPLAWTHYAKLYPSLKPEEIKFLLECAPHLEAAVLPFALNRVCQYRDAELLACYLDRILSFFEPQIKTYQSYLCDILISLIDANPSIEISYPKVREAISAARSHRWTLLLQTLKESMSLLKTHPKDWWNNFQKLKKSSLDHQSKACDLLFQEAFDYLISSYPSTINLHNAGSFLDDLIKALPFFANHKDLRLTEQIQALTTFLKDRPKEKQLWSQYFTLLEHLKKEDLFIEACLTALETVASMKTPPLECFKKAIPKLKNRLSDSEQKRLGAIYGLVILKTQKGQEIKGAIPSVQWLMDQLQTPHSWEIFAGVALHFHPKPPLEISDASWIASHLLKTPTSPVAPHFIQYLLGQNLNTIASSDLKFAVAGLIARTTHRTKELFQLFMKLPTRGEKQLFDRYRDLYNKGSMDALKKLLEDYFTPPPSLQIQVTEALSKNPVSPATLNLMKKLPSTELIFWKHFFQVLDNQSNNDLLKETWQVWLETHPIQNIRPEEEEYWNIAIHTCFRPIFFMKNEFSAFLTSRLLPLLIQLKGNACKPIAATCLNLASGLCWIEEEQRSQRLHALEKILSSPELKAKIGDPWLGLIKTFEARLAILLANQTDPALSSIGHQEVILIMTDIELGENYKAEDNKKLFHAYCVHPYVPVDHLQQYSLHVWIEKSWDALKPTLNGEMVCKLMQNLCKFNYKEQGPENTSFDSMTIYRKWEDLAMGSWGASLVLNQGSVLTFLKITCSLIRSFIKQTDNLQTIPSTLASLHQKFYSFMNTVAPQDLLSLNKFQMCYCSNVFYLMGSKTPENYQILQLALEDLNAALQFIKTSSNQDSTYAIYSFIFCLSQILEISAPYENLMNLIQTIISEMMDISWVVVINKDTPHNWVQLLRALCTSVQNATSKTRNTLEKFVLNVFMNCTHQTRLKKSTFKNSLINNSAPILTSFFLTMPLTSLTLTDFETLIKGLSSSNIQEMLFHLFEQSSKSDFNKLCIRSLAAARLIRFMNPDNILESCHPYCLKPLPPFEPLQPITLQLLIRSQWIMAIAAFMQHFKNGHAVLFEILKIRKIKLTKELTQLTLPLMTQEESYNAYFAFLIEILGDDLEITTTVFKNFQIPSDIPPEIALKLNQLKSFIEMKIQHLT